MYRQRTAETIACRKADVSRYRDPCWRVVRLGASNEDKGSARQHPWDVQHDPPRNVPQHESFARQPVRATEREGAHVREIVNGGESTAAPAILAGVVLGFVVPIATVLMLLTFGVAQFPS
jgi:hypothetical protein